MLTNICARTRLFVLLAVPASAFGPAATFGLIQAAAAFFWVYDAGDAGRQHIVWMVGGLTFLLGLLIWRRFARKSGGMSAGQGAAAGFLTSLLMHPVLFLLLPLVVALHAGNQENASDLLTALLLMPLSGLFLLFFAGLPPLILCTLAGCFWGRAQARPLS